MLDVQNIAKTIFRVLPPVQQDKLLEGLVRTSEGSSPIESFGIYRSYSFSPFASIREQDRLSQGLIAVHSVKGLEYLSLKDLPQIELIPSGDYLSDLPAF